MSAQPRVLWIAPHLPSNDRDGGGKRMLEMIRALTEHGSAVHVWARDAGDAERDGPQIDAVGASWSGTSMAVRDGWRGSADDDVLALLDPGGWDLIVVSFARTSAMLRRTIRRRCPEVPIVVDNADLHYLRRSRMPGVARRKTGKRAELREYRLSDGVIVASEDEQDILAKELPTVPTFSFTVGPGRPRTGPGLQARSGAMFLGALTHPPNEDAVRWWAEEIGPRVAERMGRVVPLTVWGTGTEVLADTLPVEQRPFVDLRGWAPSVAAACDEARVFLAPLRFGAGTKSKVLDALSNGLPMVTTSIGAEGFPPHVQAACDVGHDADGLADLVGRLLVDASHWHARRADVVSAAGRRADEHAVLARDLFSWLRSRTGEA